MRRAQRTGRAWAPAGLAIAVALAVPGTAAAASADLSIEKADSADPVAAGADLTYTLTVANAGPDTADGIQVTDKLPNQLDLVSTKPSQGACATKGSREVTCELGALADGATATVNIVVRARRDGQITNQASVSSADTDPQAANDSDAETTVVTAPPQAPKCAGKTATIFGSGRGETLVGTKGRDVIAGLGGGDEIRGLGGKDLICGAGGDDLIRGEGDDDLLRGGTGDDRLRGGNGDDLLRSQGGRDRLAGGRDRDTLRGGGRRDKLRGGGGRDALVGGTGRDRCRGGGGNDAKRSC